MEGEQIHRVGRVRDTKSYPFHGVSMTPSGLVAHTLEESFSPALHFVRDCGGHVGTGNEDPRLNAIIRLVDAQWTVNIRVGSSTASSGNTDRRTRFIGNLIDQRRLPSQLRSSTKTCTTLPLARLSPGA